MSEQAIVRVDRYTLEIDGKRVTANEDQERCIRAMPPEVRARFVAIMKGE